MATEPAAPHASTISPDEQGIRIYSHSNLFYWWPVWAMGFLMALLTWIDGHRMVVVPDGSKAYREVQVQDEKGETVTREAIVLPPGTHKPLPQVRPTEPGDGQLPPLIPTSRRMADSHSFGVIFMITLLLVIIITNVPLRGLWSVVVIVTIFLLAIIFALAGWWDRIFQWINLLDIRINMAGYLFLALALFAMWLVAMYFFDRQQYIEFTPGQVKVCTEIGGGEKTYDTTGMTVEKKRSDLFRHWILGLGSGDMTVNTAGAAVHHIELPNVLFINSKVKLVEDMLREKAMVRGR